MCLSAEFFLLKNKNQEEGRTWWPMSFWEAEAIGSLYEFVNSQDYTERLRLKTPIKNQEKNLEPVTGRGFYIFPEVLTGVHPKDQLSGWRRTRVV